MPRSVKYYRISSPWLFQSAVSAILVTGFLRAVQPRALRNPDPTNAILAKRVVTFLRKEGLAEGAEPGMGSPR